MTTRVVAFAAGACAGVVDGVTCGGAIDGVAEEPAQPQSAATMSALAVPARKDPNTELTAAPAE